MLGSSYVIYGFRVVLFWTELKPYSYTIGTDVSFRVVLFWTELKHVTPVVVRSCSFRVVLFWTELKRNLTIMSYIMFYKV